MLVEYLKPSKADLPEIILLIDKYFGKGFHLTKVLFGPDCYCVVAKVEQKIIGMSCGYFVVPSSDTDMSKTSLANNEDRIGLLDIIVVEEVYRKKGVGKKLFRSCIEKMNRTGVTEFALFHWKEGNFPEPKIAIQQGFQLKETIPFFWKKSSLQENFSCKKCGDPPCNCTADLYLKG